MRTWTHTPPFAQAKVEEKAASGVLVVLFLFVLWKIQPCGSSQETRRIFVGRLWQQQVAQTKEPS